MNKLKRVISFMLVALVLSGIGAEVFASHQHQYDNGYDPECNTCGEQRVVDLTRPMVDMFRMYDPNSGEHFYTGSAVERDELVSVGWNYEGVGFTFPLITGKSVYRLYDPVTGEHLYTMDEAEKQQCIAQGWNYEGVAFNSGFEWEVPQYRLHNPNESRGAYHFTSSEKEKNYLISLGWEYQGIGWYSCGAVVNPPLPESDLLTLVNPWNPMKTGYVPRLADVGRGESVDIRCKDDLMAMLSDCEEAGYAPYICSSYRTMEKQTRLYENKVKRLMRDGLSEPLAREQAARSVAKPGTSEHQLGLAVDIIDSYYTNLDRWQASTGTQRWLMKNCWKYGFILRYPDGKSDITGIIYEPWHYRYVGKTAAKAIHESGLCLEEWLKMN